MIKNIYIKNYALIEKLDIDFNHGFTVITGETGAGKSILLGALSLILGKRADTSVLKNKDTKCIVEATFDIEKYNLEKFFIKNDLDYNKDTNIRREIIPAGKSRAFINDTPVNLSTLQTITEQLIDIHSQNENLNLNNLNFQLKVIDAYAKTEKNLNLYKKNYSEYKKAQKKLNEIIEKAEKEKTEFDYLQFRFEELENANLTENEQEIAEEELRILSHSEEIQKNLSIANINISNDENGVIKNLLESITALSNITKYHSKSIELKSRLDSVKIEIEDLAPELDTLANDIEYNPQEIQKLTKRLDLIYSLQKKHIVTTVKELINIKNDIQNKLIKITSYKTVIAEIEKELELITGKLKTSADKLSTKRKTSIPSFEKNIVRIINELGIPYGKFIVEFEQTDNFKLQGTDSIKFLFSANKSSLPQEITKIASGGEISRLMLSIKSVIANSVALPAIIFDEIDTGISGEIADKTANIMLRMSKTMQVIDITHLPQVAAKANNHFFVYKEENESGTNTQIRQLTKEERINETAKMLSGEKITEASLKNAIELLKL